MVSRMSSTVKRIQVDLPEKSLARLYDLKSKTEAGTYTEVIKNALKLYDAIVSEAEAGNTFMVKTATGELKEYIVF